MRFAKSTACVTVVGVVVACRSLLQSAVPPATATVMVQPVAPTKPIAIAPVAIAIPATQPTTRPICRPHTIPGVENFAQVSDVLYRGAQPTAEGFAELQRMGIKTIINLRALNSDPADLRGTGMQYVALPCKALTPEEDDVIQFLKIASDPANQPVFVHCQHGSDRTGAMVAIYRLVEQGWTLENALAEVDAFGYHTAGGELASYLKRFTPESVRSRVQNAAMAKIDAVE